MPEDHSRPEGKLTVETCYLYFERWLKSVEKIEEERDKRYEEKFKGVEKLMAASFAANDKAIVKAESAQQAHNATSNEFRGQLKDQADRLISRDEAFGRFKAFEEKFEAHRKHFEERADDNKKEIAKLREQQMSWLGKETQRLEGRQQTQWSVSQVIAVVFGLTGFAVAIFEMLRHTPKP